ncbi:MAG TPA: amino acid-binding protein, partial [Thalassospira sp.]|nr:amino acid-binding protein [Thalassospira sp.]
MAVPALAEDANTGPTQINQPASACRTLSVGGADGWEPISYIRENGQHTGLAIDILRDYAKRHDLRVEVNLDIPWTRAMQMLG